MSDQTEREPFRDRCTAFHEAGHAVLTYRIGFYTDAVTIEPNDKLGTAGLSRGEGAWSDGSRDADYIVTLFAGYAAEKHFNPQADDVCSASDFEQAEDLLRLRSDLSKQDLWQTAEALVLRHWPEISAVAAALINDRTLSGEETEIICDAIDEHEDWQKILNEYRRRAGRGCG
jgi:hypothetical protein